jgi:hypothetical protein
MKLNLCDKLDRQRFQRRCAILLERGSFVELREIAPKSRSQNNYLHLLIGVVAIDTGNTLDFVKEWYFKRLVNPDIFVRKTEDKFAGEIETIRSTAELTKEETSMAIDRFKRWGNENGFYMPEPGDESLLRSIEIEMGRLQKYL